MVFWVYVMSCTLFDSVGVGVRVLVMYVHSTTSVRVRVRVEVCGYTYNRGWGLWIYVQSNAYAEKIETYYGHSLLNFVRICVCMLVHVRGCSSSQIFIYIVKVVNR